jgi:transcription elongation factor SPT5
LKKAHGHASGDEELSDEDSSSHGYGYDEESGEDDEADVRMLPGVSDPQMWQVRVKKNYERTAIISLTNKHLYYQSIGKPLSILSVTCSDTTEGYIYVEAFKEIHVRQACEGLNFILNKFILVAREEMPVIYQNDQAKNSELREHQWVRIKNSGPYNGDIALVEYVSENKVWVRLVPRVDQTALSSKNKAARSFARVPQKLNFRPTQAMGGQIKHHAELRKDMMYWKNQLFHKGFAFKNFPFKQIETSADIKPTYEELINFQATINKTGITIEQQEDSGDDEKIETVIKTALLRGGSSVYVKGDKISINKGEFTGLKGTVISVEDSTITFQALNVPALTQHLPVEVSMVSKYFEPGDMVRIIEGKYQGDTGQVIDVEDSKVSMKLDSTGNFIKMLVNNLKLKSDTDNNLIAALTQKAKGIQGQFSANDLVNFNNGRNIGLVLQVYEDYLKIVDQ